MKSEISERSYSQSEGNDPEHPIVSVVVVNFNGLRFLEDCIHSLIAQTWKNLEIIIVDNASSDGSVEYLSSHFDGLVLIENTQNLGFAAGVNTGIRNARGSYIMTLNNDTRVDCHCIERLLTEMMSNNSLGMCAPKMLFPDGRINSAGICISRSGAAWDRGMFEDDVGQYDVKEYILGPCAGAAMYRRAMLEEVCLFDEDFFLYMEDVDLAFRAQLAGWKCVFIPEAVVYHHHGGSAGFQSDITIYYGNRNILWWPVKNHPAGILLPSIPWILGRTLIVIPYYAFKGKGKVILRSKIDGLAGIPGMWKKRRYIRRTVSTSYVKTFLSTWNKSNKRSHVDY